MLFSLLISVKIGLQTSKVNPPELFIHILYLMQFCHSHLTQLIASALPSTLMFEINHPSFQVTDT